jgi:5-methylcytosine-specific restriction endonuclease McrA
MERSRYYRGGGTQRARQRKYLARRYPNCANPGCGVELDWETPGLPHSGEADHIVPVSLGGSLATGNLQGLCKACNRQKGARHPDEPIPTATAGPWVRPTRPRPAPRYVGPHHDDEGNFHDDTPGAPVRFATYRTWTP